MSKAKSISAEQMFARWRKDPAYARAFAELEGEYAIAAALIAARSHAGLIRPNWPAPHGHDPERHRADGGGKVRPSTTTLEKVASATGTRLRVRFEPDASAA